MVARSFTFPANLQDLEEDSDPDSSGELIRLTAASPLDISAIRPADVDDLVRGLAFDLSDKEIFCVEDQHVFDRIYSLTKGFCRLSPSSKSTFVETLRSNLGVLLLNLDSLTRAAAPLSPISSSDPSSNASVPDFTERIHSHRNALRIYTFFLLTIALMAEETAARENAATTTAGFKAGLTGRKKTAAHSWNWEVQRARLVNLIASSLEVNRTLLFGRDGADEDYLSFVSKCTFTLYENPAVLKDADTKDSLGHLIGTIATKHGRLSQSCASILHLIHKFDFTVPHLAEAVVGAEKRYADGSLAVALIREIGRADPRDYVRDGVGAENVGRFLVELAGRTPKIVSTNIGVLNPHFGGESYKIRNALVGVLGKLVVKAFKDVDGDMSSKSLRLRGKQAMIEILIERCRDVSAYTRSRVLQVWMELCEEHAVSIGLWNEVASATAGRLEDKSAIVRKSALNLLITMLQHNPFGPQLRVAAFEVTLEKYKEKLQGLEPAETSEDAPDVGVVCSETPLSQEESAGDSCLPYSEQHTANDLTIPDVGSLEQIRALVASLDAGLRFSRCIALTMPTLVQLLASSSVTDVENTILLLMRCRQFQIDGSDACLRKMFPLVFSQDKSIREAVENAFITVYLTKNPVETARNLLNLVVDCSIGDLAALECLICSLLLKGEISTSTMSALWDFFCFNVSGVVASQSRGALSILCMAAKSSPGVLSSHLLDIIDIGFGRWSKEEPLLARTACIALERLSDEDKEKVRSNGSKVFCALQSLLIGSWLPDNIWYSAADKAINAIYSIHPTPETFAAGVVKKSLNTVFSSGRDQVHSFEGNEDMDSLSAPASNLGRCLFIISHVALNQLVYVESCIRKIQKQKSMKDKLKHESQLFKDGNAEADEGQGINAELGLAASEDAIIDALSERAEKEIVSSSSCEKNIIGCCAPFLSKLCRNFTFMQKFPDLQASAMLALCRLMIIDAVFCEANLQLLFTVAEGAPSEIVRSNCTVALGDLAVRFPNLLEPWTDNMYSRLRDSSVSVRKNAVLVLSHLILNDMMKVKGYINEIAMRIEDEEERISNLAKLFFHELSKKGNNPIYSLLPDILSRLSNQNLKEEAFCNIMQFLINSIKKDRQMEALVEKLCNRITGVSDVKEAEHIVFCLSQLSFNEKGMRKLIDCFKAYEHMLSEDRVMDHFRNIISKSKKFAKPELKACIEEFEEKLNKIHLEKKEQEMAARNAQVHKGKVGGLEGLMITKKNAHKRNAVQKTVDDGSGEVVNSSSEDNTDDRDNYAIANHSITDDSYASSSITEDGEDEMEVQSPRTNCEGVHKSRRKGGNASSVKHPAEVLSTRRPSGSVRRSRRIL